MNDKQSGDVKRYGYAGDGDDSIIEQADGPWVLYSDIAHLLKPQESGELEALKQKYEKHIGGDCDKEIEKLEAENRLLLNLLESERKARNGT